MTEPTPPPPAPGPRIIPLIAPEAYHQLLELLSDTGTPPPCQTSPNLWTSERPTDQRTAAEACLDCPHMQACADYATHNGEAAGVWGATTSRERLDDPAWRSGLDEDAEDFVHGSFAYRHRGCRCDVCTTAARGRRPRRPTGEPPT